MEQIGGTPYMQVSYQKVHDLSMGILHAYGNEDSNYLIFALALTVARLSNDHKLEPSVETDYVSALAEWNDLYWSIDPSGVKN